MKGEIMIINKVIVSYQNPDNMEQINKLTSLDFDHTDNWVDYSTFEDKLELQKFIDDEKLQALKNGEADYIAFRIDY